MPNSKNLLRFVEVIKKLRGPEGCPWDKEQTHQSLKPYLIEETYEVLEAIDSHQPEHLKEELGDLLLQIFLHAQIAQDENSFTIDDVAHDIAEKMIRRHPHVFGDLDVQDAQTVLQNWEEIKKQEKSAKGIEHNSVLDGIPNNLPALFESHKLAKKASKQGFDWQQPQDIYEKVDEELREVKEAIIKKDTDKIEEELGDLLFTISNLCRLYKVNPELALKKSNKKFRHRFEKMEKLIEEKNIAFKDITFKMWNDFWNQIK